MPEITPAYCLGDESFVFDAFNRCGGTSVDANGCLRTSHFPVSEFFFGVIITHTSITALLSFVIVFPF